MSKQPFIDQLDQAIDGILTNAEPMPVSADPAVGELLGIAADLRYLPRPDFKTKLKADLERKAIMSTKTVEFRSGFRTITPYLLPPGPEFVDFLKRVFDAEETYRGETGPGRFHAEFRIGDSMVMVGVGSGRSMPVSLELYVPDVDEVYKRAIDAGCKELQSVRDAHWEPIRLGCVQDPAGNMWSIVTHLGGNYIPQGRNSLSLGFVVAGAAGFIDFLKQAFSAQEVQRYEWPGGLYASIRLGESVVGVSESTNHEWMRPMPAMIYMYVPDCDAIYDQALRTGAKSISPVANQSYGDRHGGVQDTWGNQWYIATPIR
jgi:PhnB protein